MFIRSDMSDYLSPPHPPLYEASAHTTVKLLLSGHPFFTRNEAFQGVDVLIEVEINTFRFRFIMSSDLSREGGLSKIVSTVLGFSSRSLQSFHVFRYLLEVLDWPAVSKVVSLSDQVWQVSHKGFEVLSLYDLSCQWYINIKQPSN